MGVIFWSVLWHFSLILENRLVSSEFFFTYILDNILAVVRLKNFMGGIALCIGLFLVLFFEREEGGKVSDFSLFLEICFL